MKYKTIKTGCMGKLIEPIWVYCNEKTYKGKGFFFACCKGCEHNPTPEQLVELKPIKKEI